MRVISLIALAACLYYAAAHTSAHHKCVHDDVLTEAAEAHDRQLVSLLHESDSGSITHQTITRRQLSTMGIAGGAADGGSAARRLQSSTQQQYLARPWGGLRVLVEYVDLDGPGRDADMTQAKVDQLKNDIIPGVVSKLRSVLQVSRRPIFGSHRGLSLYWDRKSRFGNLPPAAAARRVPLDCSRTLLPRAGPPPKWHLLC